MIPRGAHLSRLELLIVLTLLWGVVGYQIAKRINRLIRIVQHDRRRRRWERRKAEIDAIARAWPTLEGPPRQAALSRALLLLAAEEGDPWPDLS